MIQSLSQQELKSIEREPVNAVERIRPRRTIRGMSAILLPFTSAGSVDWQGLERQLLETFRAGLTPAVNMDTGFGNLIDYHVRRQVLSMTAMIAGKNEFVAGAFVSDQPGDRFDAEAYERAAEPILQVGGTPVLFQSYGLTQQESQGIIDAYARIGEFCPRFIAFELGEVFAPFGAIYDLATYAKLLCIPQCIGAKHSSLNRRLEWQRLCVRDRVRPEFMVLTGNDLAIDMVIYGSDYLLGLASFAPDRFAQRDRMWAEGDSGFFQLNDALQAIGSFAFRNPVPAYKHSAAQFLKLRGWIQCDNTHEKGIRRPDSDRAVLHHFLEMLEDSEPIDQDHRPMRIAAGASAPIPRNRPAVSAAP